MTTKADTQKKRNVWGKACGGLPWHRKTTAQLEREAEEARELELQREIFAYFMLGEDE